MLDNPRLWCRFSLARSTSLVAIAILMISFPGLGLLTPRAAFASVTITPSSNHWFGPGLVRIIITDTSQNTAGASIAPHISVKRGSVTLASADPPISSPGTSGTFELYLTTSNAPFAPAFPSNPDNYAVGRINSQPNTQLRDFSLTLAPNDYLRDGDSVIVSYAGQSTTIQFAKSIVVASVDRTVAGDGNRIVLTLTDQNANVDPTAVGIFAADPSILSVVAGSGTMNFTGARFIEEGQNSGAFDLVITVTSAAGNAVNPNNGATLKDVQLPSSAQFMLHGFAVYANIPSGATFPYDSVTPDLGAVSTQTVVLENSDAVITIGNHSNSSGATSTAVSVNLRTIPTVIRSGEMFWINATITNNSTSTIQYSGMCSPSFSISFEPAIVNQDGRPCNIMAVLEQLQPGQSATVRIPGFDGQFFAAGESAAVNATVQFQYQLPSQAYTTKAVSQSISFSILPTNATVGESFQLGFNQTLAVKPANIGIRFSNVTEDSRCPSDVRCISAGRATVQIQVIQNPSGNQMGQFNLTQSGATSASSNALVNGFTVTLQRVDPYPLSKVKLQLSDYVITLIVNESSLQSIGVSAPKVRAEGGGPNGSRFTLESSASSEFNGMQKFIAVFEVRSLDNGVTDFMGFANGTIFGNQTLIVMPSSSWIPSAPGTYQVRLFAIDNISVPGIVSNLSVSEVRLVQ